MPVASNFLNQNQSQFVPKCLYDFTNNIKNSFNSVFCYKTKLHLRKFQNIQFSFAGLEKAF